MWRAPPTPHTIERQTERRAEEQARLQREQDERDDNDSLGRGLVTNAEWARIEAAEISATQAAAAKQAEVCTVPNSVAYQD